MWLSEPYYINVLAVLLLGWGCPPPSYGRGVELPIIMLFHLTYIKFSNEAIQIISHISTSRSNRPWVAGGHILTYPVIYPFLSTFPSAIRNTFTNSMSFYGSILIPIIGFSFLKKSANDVTSANIIMLLGQFFLGQFCKAYYWRIPP